MLTPLLEVDNVHMRFGGVHSLRGVSIEVPEGSIVGLIGPNGAGKTTLFNVASGLLRPMSGTVRLRGADVTRLPAYRRAALGLGRSFQNLGLIPGESIKANVLSSQFISAGYGLLSLVCLPWRRCRAERRLWHRGVQALAEFEVHAAPECLVSELSFGVARRVELAGLVARNPSLLLLDEPTTGLDTQEIEVLKACLQRRRELGTTILVVAHDVGFVLDMCDDVYVLAEGAVIFHGSAQDARADTSVAESFMGSAA
jgi:branched-chain amino acid transport system ATP-binding protein